MNSPLSGMQQAIQIKGAGKPSLEKKAYQELRKQIINAVYQPGTLLSENELADTLGMSRTPIRAAISLLETEGFLESVRGRGVFVKEISFREFREMFEVLVSMQLFVLDVAASRGLAFDLPALRSIWRGKALLLPKGITSATTTARCSLSERCSPAAIIPIC